MLLESTGLSIELIEKCLSISRMSRKSLIPIFNIIDTVFMDEISAFTMKMINFGVGIFFGCYVFVTSLNYSAERQVE